MDTGNVPRDVSRPKHKRKRKRQIVRVRFTTQPCKRRVVHKKLAVPPSIEFRPSPLPEKTVEDALWYALLAGVKTASENELAAIQHCATCAILLYAVRIGRVFSTSSLVAAAAAVAPTLSEPLRNVVQDVYLNFCGDTFLLDEFHPLEPSAKRLLLLTCAPLFSRLRFKPWSKNMPTDAIVDMVESLRCDKQLSMVRNDDNLFDIAYLHYLVALRHISPSPDAFSKRLKYLQTSTAIAAEVDWSYYDVFLERI
jgi:hypothetical protein